MHKLPPHSVPRACRPSKPGSVRKPTASSSPLIASAKQACVTSSTASRPKSSQASGPAQVTPFSWASRPSCRAVTSLWPTQRVPRSTLRATSFQSMRSSSRVRPYPPRVASATLGACSATRCSAATRVSSSPAKRCFLASAAWSMCTSKPSALSRLAARRNGPAEGSTPAGVKRVSKVIDGFKAEAAADRLRLLRRPGSARRRRQRLRDAADTARAARRRSRAAPGRIRRPARR